MAYIKKIGVGNFRVFKEYTEFDLAPITVLTGKNNSGKSSLIKALLLMKQNNICNKPPDKLSMDTEELNIESFNKIINFNNKNNEFILSFSTFSNSINLEIIIKIHYYNMEENAEVRSVTVSDFNNEELIKVQMHKDKKTYDFIYNSEYFINKITKENQYIIDNIDNYISEFDEDRYEIEAYSFPYVRKKINIFERFNRKFKNINYLDINRIIYHSIRVFKRNKIEQNKFNNNINEYIKYRINEYIKSGSELNSKDIKSLNKKNEKIPSNISGKSFFNFKNFMPKNLSSRFGKDIIEELKNNAELIPKTNYLTSIRGNHKMVYSDYDNYALNTLLRDINNNKTILNTEIYKKFLDTQLERFEIGTEIINENIERVEGVASIFSIVNNDKKQLLSDLGLGYSQILPIIFKILLIAEKYHYRTLFIIEEPEVNLHPDLQSKLADMFVEAGKKFNIQFIIETHSEYLIRRLQYLTAKKELKPLDTAIYYFNNPNKISGNEKQVERITINEFGDLSKNYGEGFFDESIKLKTDLIKIQNQQLN